MRNNILCVIAFAALLAISCSKQTTQDDPETDLMTISFAPQLAQPTRTGHLDTEGSFAIGDVIGVFGYQKEAGVDWANNERPSLMHNVTLTKQSFVTDDTNVTNYVYYPQKMWPSLPDKARFFAYYPHNSSVPNGVITPSDATYSGYPFVEVALGLSQKPIDFVTAQTNLVNKTEGDAVVLAFEHRLSKLIFKVKASGLSKGLSSEETRKMYINQLTVKNVYNKAIYTFNDLSDGGTWGGHSLQEIDASTGATIPVNSMMAAVSETIYQDLIDPNGVGSYLLMLPQVYGNVVFEVMYTLERLNDKGGCEDHTIAVKHFPVSVDWKSGQVYTYYLEFGFSEVDEGGVTLGLVVEDWKTGGYNIEMGQ